MARNESLRRNEGEVGLYDNTIPNVPMIDMRPAPIRQKKPKLMRKIWLILAVITAILFAWHYYDSRNCDGQCIQKNG